VDVSTLGLLEYSEAVVLLLVAVDWLLSALSTPMGHVLYLFDQPQRHQGPYGGSRPIAAMNEAEETSGS